MESQLQQVGGTPCPGDLMAPKPTAALAGNWCLYSQPERAVRGVGFEQRGLRGGEGAMSGMGLSSPI